MYDQTEREQQTALALAINNSQDNERTYREKNKYLSLITGIIGGVLGLVGSSINNWRHRKDIKSFASDISDQVVDLKTSVERLKLVVSADGALQNGTADWSAETGDLLSKIKSHHDTLDESIKSLQSLLKNDSSNEIVNYSPQSNEGNLEEIINKFERNITSRLNNHAYLNLSLIGSCTFFVSLFVFYVTRSS